MKTQQYKSMFAPALLAIGMGITPLITMASNSGWSAVPYIGASFLGNQTATVSGADNFGNGMANVDIDNGFTAGIGIRYDYEDSPWVSEIGWEYRSNDSRTSTADNTVYPTGNYASNTFYINGRYVLSKNAKVTPWVGGGLIYVQEIDLDNENADEGRSFSSAGDIGFQAMLGADINLTDRIYLSGEIRYTGLSGIDLTQEGNTGRASGIDYQPITLGLGVGFRF